MHNSIRITVIGVISMLMANVKIPGKLLAPECELLQNSLLHSDVLVRPHRVIASSVLFVGHTRLWKHPLREFQQFYRILLVAESFYRISYHQNVSWRSLAFIYLEDIFDRRTYHEIPCICQTYENGKSVYAVTFSGVANMHLLPNQLVIGCCVQD